MSVESSAMKQFLSKKNRCLILFFILFFSQGFPQQTVSFDRQVSYEVSANSIPSTSGPNYNLFVLDSVNQTSFNIINRTLIIEDLDGKVLFMKKINPYVPLADCSAEFVNSTTLLYGEPDGAHLWNLQTDVNQFLNISGHHDFEKNYDNDSYYSLTLYSRNIGGFDYRFDYVVEYDSNGQVLWTKDLYDFIKEYDWCPFHDKTGEVRDVTHANTVFYDEEETAVYVNVRNVNTFYKIDYKTGDVIWGLGELGDFTLFDLRGNQKENLFFHAHSIEKIDDNKYLIFDNDLHNQTDANNQRSRLVEITVDEDKMYANVSWEWVAPSDYYSIIWGDCDPLTNGNYLGVFGTTLHPGTSLGARIVEITKEGQIAWEKSYDKVNDVAFGIYRMERFHFTPIVSTPQFYQLESENGYAEWDVWYNFKSKNNFSGEYFIYVDNQLKENGDIVFQRYWRKSSIQYYLNDLPEGEHNITLVVADEGGHLSNENNIDNYAGSILFQVNWRMNVYQNVFIGAASFLGVTVIILLIRNKDLFNFIRRRNDA